MTGTDLSLPADGKLPLLPMQVRVSLSSNFVAFDARDAARDLTEYASAVPGLARQMRAACRPVGREDLNRRMTALGMTMAPTRPAAEATMWLHEMARLLGDFPKDILFESVDDCQRRSRFLPTVAEIREVADPLLAERKTQAARLEAIVNVLNAPPPVTHDDVRDHGRLCTGEQAEEILKEYGLLDAVRGGQSAKPVNTAPLRKPTRQDYIDMGVDPAVLDRIEQDRRAA